jgi:hypothetical protein
VFLLRISLPDRPGSLGQVATAMGSVGADILAIEIVEKRESAAVDDFLVELPSGGQPDALVSACNALPGVEVLWVGYHSASYGLLGDVELLNRMAEEPDGSAGILTMGAPTVFRSDWALLIHRPSQKVLAWTEAAPELGHDDVAALGQLTQPATEDLPAGWLSGWGETLIAKAPCRHHASIVIGRHGGPDYSSGELARLKHLAALAN